MTTNPNKNHNGNNYTSRNFGMALVMSFGVGVFYAFFLKVLDWFYNEIFNIPYLGASVVLVIPPILTIWLVLRVTKKQIPTWSMGIFVVLTMFFMVFSAVLMTPETSFDEIDIRSQWESLSIVIAVFLFGGILLGWLFKKFIKVKDVDNSTDTLDDWGE